MLQVPLTPELERQLADVAARTGDAPAELARRALLAYMEDLEDYAIAVEAWREHDPTQALTTVEILHELGLAD